MWGKQNNGQLNMPESNMNVILHNAATNPFLKKNSQIYKDIRI